MIIEPKNHSRLDPFGAPDCESDLQILGESHYSKYYLKSTYFHAKSLDRSVYLIVGRRGSGKTALLRSFSFQNRMHDSIEVSINEPESFHEVISNISQIAEHTSWNKDLQISKMVRIWEYVVWCAIFHELRDKDIEIRAACLSHQGEGVSKFIATLIRSLLGKYLGSDNVTDELDKIFQTVTFQRAKEAVEAIAENHPIIIALDTLEQYSIDDVRLMNAAAALVEFASRFSRDYSSKNIHIKVFMMDEIFPYLTEQYISNTLKYVREEVYLHWRPKDLIRLICWRLFKYLEFKGILRRRKTAINWESYRDVRNKVWTAYFGESCQNGNHFAERTFPYVLRHTQLRPRQLIVLCNSIAQHAIDHGNFPNFSSADIIAGIKNKSSDLSTEVFSAYKSPYPNAGLISDALSGCPAMFKAKELDRRGPQTASQWHDKYSPYRFRQLLAELGIIGRVRHYDKTTGIVEADFEYFKKERMALATDDMCVIHPMFYTRLNVTNPEHLLVYPFPDHPEFNVLKHSETE